MHVFTIGAICLFVYAGRTLKTIESFIHKISPKRVWMANTNSRDYSSDGHTLQKAFGIWRFMIMRKLFYHFKGKRFVNSRSNRRVLYHLWKGSNLSKLNLANAKRILEKTLKIMKIPWKLCTSSHPQIEYNKTLKINNKWIQHISDKPPV